MILYSIFLGSSRSRLLILGLLGLSMGAVLIASASQTTLVVADRELDQYWRTAYDILVRPTGSRSPIEEKYGLVESNHLSGLWGGITFEQYESIKSIPDVEVAAPIAMLTRVLGDVIVLGQGMQVPKSPGVYVVAQSVDVDEGVRIRSMQTAEYVFVGPEPPPDISALALNQGLIVNPLGVTTGSQPLDLLFAAIDPEQEAALVKLDQAVVKGEYLNEVEIFNATTYYDPLNGSKPFLHDVPVLINSTPYVKYIQHNQIERILLPPGISTLETIIERGGIHYLNTLDTETIAKETINVDSMYPVLISRFWNGEQTESDVPLEWQTIRTGAKPINKSYNQITPPFPYNGLVLEALPLNDTLTDMPSVFTLKAKGVFDIERIPRPADVNRVPLETYFPPIVTLYYGEDGHSIEPRSLRPSLFPDYYLQPPPVILTTLEAARAMRGDDAISAIRVRVALDGCPPEQPEACTVTPADQRKIEAIAIEIQRQTGLDVDIMVGSSPTRVLVHVPGIGYVEEQWIQKGVNLTYKRGIQTGNWLLLGTLLLAGGLFTLDLTWAEVLSRRRVVALQKALGWRSRSVFAQVVGQVMMIGAIATAAGTFIALMVIRWLGWEAIPSNLLIGLPLLVMGLCGIGSLLPAWSASRVPPIVELQRGGVRYHRKRTNPVLGLWMFAWSEIKRRTVRSLLTGLGSALSAGLLTLLLGVTLQQRGMLNGTLLGEFILVNVEGYHYAIVGIGLGLAFLSTFNGLLGSILERRREIGVLKAIGWRTSSVARLFIAQGIILGIVGGSVGALAGTLTFFYLYQSISADMMVAILLGISLPGLVGALAALYPARLAANVPPAEAVRYE
ncbi:MAG: FtsX-like permease family protein [Anaerolineaceae bacterium]|nr:FtsX-like permease family protein [Anaerolineaceae bacterium]OQY89431.1 MAG: hypothetical protein B6D38_07230 [Anaerolineae bacterium UTCFX1]